MKNKHQDKVLEIIAQNTRGEWFVMFPDIDLSQVKTSSLHLLYKAVDGNILYLLSAQKVLNEVISNRAKQAEQKAAGVIGISPEAIHALEEISEELKAKLLLDIIPNEE